MLRLLTDFLILVVVAAITLGAAFLATRLLVELGLFGDPNHAGTGYAAAFFGLPVLWVVLAAWGVSAVSAWRKRRRDRQ